MTAALADRLARALAETADDPMSMPLADDPAAFVMAPEPAVPAAVLIAITDRPRPGVILTQRTPTLRRHGGQVAFPGGRVDPGDTDMTAAALREAEEEIALPPEEVHIVGQLPAYHTITGYAVSPVIGVTRPDLPLVPAEAEVSAWFEAPLDILLDPARHRRASRVWQGIERHYVEIDWPERHIWGATAAMIVTLSYRLRTFR